MKSNSNTLSYKIKRSNRKSISIQIDKQGAVIVKAPNRISIQSIETVIKKHKNWIYQHQKEQHKKWMQQEKFQLEYGDMLLLKGEKVPLLESTGPHALITASAFYIPPALEPKDRLLEVIKLYREAAAQILQEKTAFYSKQMGLYPNRVKVGAANTRWGSCSSKKNINFTWKLVMAREKAIDYVVIHELAHLKEMNHSNRFWQIVYNFCPDYPDEIQHLKELQKQLSIQNWENK